MAYLLNENLKPHTRLNPITTPLHRALRAARQHFAHDLLLGLGFEPDIDEAWPGNVDIRHPLQVSRLRQQMRAQLFGQEDRAVARAAPRNQHSEALPERLPAGKTVMVEHWQRIEQGADQPLAFVGGIARRVGQCLVLGAYLGQVGGV